MRKFLKQIYKRPSAFKFINEVENDGLFSHSVFKAKKLKNFSSTNQWFVKPLNEKRTEAIAETLAQETMRLILSQQPKTRRLIEITPEKRIHYYTLSKEIPYFDDRFFLFPNNNEQVLDSKITGLAATQVLALWLNEVDFKAGNVGINQHKQVVKIDGGLSFITLNPNFNYLHGKEYRITSEDLEALPNLINYQACNWLHHIYWCKEGYTKKNQPTELDKRINQNANFKNEVYQTILRIISLPDDLIRFFTHNYIANPADVTKFSNFMIERKQQLEIAAHNISDFKAYRLSAQGQEEISSFLNYLRAFKTMENVNLFNAFYCLYGINAEALIIEKEINYLLDVFSSKLTESLEYLNLEIDNHNNPIDISSLNLKELIFYINNLKNRIVNYLTSLDNLEKDNFFNDISLVSATLKEDYLRNDTIVLPLIKMINKILAYNTQLKVIKAPSLTPKNTENFPSLPSITFFNQNQLPCMSEINHSIPSQSIFSC